MRLSERTRAARNKRYFVSSKIVMVLSLCGMPGLTNGGSAHSRVGSKTTDVQRSKHAPPQRTWGVAQGAGRSARTRADAPRREWHRKSCQGSLPAGQSASWSGRRGCWGRSYATRDMPILILHHPPTHPSIPLGKEGAGGGQGSQASFWPRTASGPADTWVVGSSGA